MRYSLEKLVGGEDEIVDYYRKAAEHWKIIWSRKETGNPFTFADLLAIEQSWFEANCGGGRIGQEVMVVSGIVGLIAENDLQRARRLYDAFMYSACGVGVKSVANEVADSYSLTDVDRFDRPTYRTPMGLK